MQNYTKAEYVIIEVGAEIGDGTRIQEFTKITRTAKIGNNCVIGQGCYIAGEIGNNVHIANNVSIYSGVTIDDEVFIGNNVSFSNVNIPKTYRPISPERYSKTTVGYGSCINPNATICPNVDIGRQAVVGHGSVVSENIPDNIMVTGNPAKVSLKSLNNKIAYEKSSY